MRIRDLVLIGVVLAASASCDSNHGPPDPGGASYAVEFSPGQVIHATLNCDRLLTHALLGLGTRERDFDLSINIVEDCSRAGGGFAFWEVLILGRYLVTDSVLSFTPESGTTPEFSGTFDATHVRLTLPPRSDSLAPTPITMQLGPRTPY